MWFCWHSLSITLCRSAVAGGPFVPAVITFATSYKAAVIGVLVRGSMALHILGVFRCFFSRNDFVKIDDFFGLIVD
ncbi:MAG: hypothetical protein ACI8VW_004147 [bacterium]|jgi:hypothetical protein